MITTNSFTVRKIRYNLARHPVKSDPQTGPKTFYGSGREYKFTEWRKGFKYS